MSPSRRTCNARAMGRGRATIAPGARPCRAPCRGQSRSMQNSQHVRDAKPRTAKPRTAPMARRRHGQRGATAATGHGMPSHAPRRWRGGAMRTSRPTAKPHEEGAATGRGGGNGARDTKPRTAVASRHGRWGAAARWGHRALPPSRTSVEHAWRARGGEGGG